MSENGGEIKSRIVLPPIRRRFWKRIATFLAVLTSSFALLLLYLEARYWREVSIRHRHGQRVLPEDFTVPPVADDQNAATYLHEVSIRLKPTPLQDWWTEHIRGRTLVPEQLQYAEELSTRADAFALLEKARQCPQVDWHVRLVSPVMDHLQLKYVNEQRNISPVYYLLAVCQHEMGNDRAAVGTVDNMLFIARAVDQQAFVVSHLVASAIDNMACDACMRMATSLQVYEDLSGSRDSATNATTRAAVVALIDQLLDDGPRHAALLEGWERDRMESADLWRTDTGNGEFVWINHRVLSLWAVDVMRRYDVAARASNALNWRGVRTTFSSVAEPTGMIASESTDRLIRPIEHHLKRMTERRVAATMLAMRLYQLDHSGAYARRLNDLVPHYMREVPIDPFSPENEPLGYILGAPPTLYSVGVDEIDGGGDRTGAIDDNGIYNPWLGPDAVFPMGAVLVTQEWEVLPSPSAFIARPGAKVKYGRVHRVEP